MGYGFAITMAIAGKELQTEGPYDVQLYYYDSIWKWVYLTIGTVHNILMKSLTQN